MYGLYLRLWCLGGVGEGKEKDPAAQHEQHELLVEPVGRSMDYDYSSATLSISKS